jgi:hypothetical protein
MCHRHHDASLVNELITKTIILELTVLPQIDPQTIRGVFGSPDNSQTG